MASHQQPSIGDDLLIGADAIAVELNWVKPDGSPHRRRVYHLAGQEGFPIHNVPGLGLVARKTALRAYFEKLDQLAFDLSKSGSAHG